MITLHTATSHCQVDPDHGARLASLILDGHEVLVRPSPGADPLLWGCYPMVPWAGRLRHGRVTLDDGVHTVQGAGVSGGHPLHGTVADRVWQVVEADDVRLRCRIDLGDRWPVAGHVDQVITLDDRGVTCELTVTADERAFPAQVGWHPWFTSAWTRQVGFRARYRRDDQVLPTGHIDAVPPEPLGTEPLDDCFVSPRWSPRLVHDDGAVLEITSDCDCWVVYDAADGRVCIEPQSGPPDGATLVPVTLPPRGALRRWMRLGLVTPEHPPGPPVTGQ